MSIESTLEERGKMYGEFKDFGDICQRFKAVLRYGSWNGMKPYQREALEMIVHKISRILNGDPDVKDSWHDIVGYAKLVDDTLKEEK